MERPEGRPDAVLFPEEWKRGGRASDRHISLVILAEVMLQLNYHAGERAHVHRQGAGQCFATMTPGPKPSTMPNELDTLLFSYDHELQQQSRYDWFPNPDGSQNGYLTEQAKEDLLETKKEKDRAKEASQATVAKMKKIMEANRAR